MTAAQEDAGPKLSDQLEEWLTEGSDQTLGGLIDTFGDKSFAVLTLVLLALPALPLPTGGVTHLFEIIAGLLALELIAGRKKVWLPNKWRSMKLAGARQQQFIAKLMKLIRRLERFSRPRWRHLFGHRITDALFGAFILMGATGAFLAPPFTGLDTLPALAVVVVSLGVLLEDILIVAVGSLLGFAGIALEIVLGSAAIHGVSSLFS